MFPHQRLYMLCRRQFRNLCFSGRGTDVALAKIIYYVQKTIQNSMLRRGGYRCCLSKDQVYCVETYPEIYSSQGEVQMLPWQRLCILCRRHSKNLCFSANVQMNLNKDYAYCVEDNPKINASQKGVKILPQKGNHVLQ